MSGFGERVPRVRLVGSAAPEGRAQVDAVSSWLDVMCGMMQGKSAERAAARAEIESHLRERVRDLMVSGLSEAESVRAAIAEVGDASELAGRFNSVRQSSYRRIAMNMAVIGVAGAAFVTSLVAVGTGGGSSGGQQPEPSQVTASGLATPFSVPLREPKGLGVVTVAPTDTAKSLIERIATGAGLRVEIGFERIGIDVNAPIGISAENEPAERVLDRLNEMLQSENLQQQRENEIGWRHRNGVLVVGSQAMLDRREIELVAYSISAVVDKEMVARHAEGLEPMSRASVAREVSSETKLLVTTLVFPDSWQDNGGDLASVVGFGETLFVTAPKRFHPKIVWVLDQITEAEKAREVSGLVESTPRIVETRGQMLTLKEANFGGPPVLTEIPLVQGFFSQPVDEATLDRCRQGASVHAEGDLVVLVPADGSEPIKVKGMRLERVKNEPK